jgi:hypothetical protein
MSLSKGIAVETPANDTRRDSPVADDERSLAEWPAIVDWVETTSTEHFKARYAAFVQIKQDAQVTFTIIAAGVGAALTLAAKIMAPGAAGTVSFGAAVLCLYLGLVAAMLVTKCMLFVPLPSIYNEPANLLLRGYTLAEIKEGELLGMQARIDEMMAINERASRWLNRARILALLSPVVFGLAATVYQPEARTKDAPTTTLECRPASGDGGPALSCRQSP